MNTNMPQQSGAAIFIDIENVIGHCATLGIPVLIKPICEKVREIAPLRFRRAFGDISKACLSINIPHQILALRKDLTANLVEIQDIPYLVSQKNSADIQIVTTALAMAYENRHITHFAFVTTDRDFVPLYGKLKEIGKIVIVISIDELKTSGIVIDAVDHLFYYEKLFSPQPVARHEKHTLLKDPLQEDDGQEKSELLQEYINLALRACEIIQNQGRTILASDLMPKIRQLQADFDLGRLGFYQLKDFLLVLENSNYIRMHSEGAGAVQIELLESAPIKNADIGAGDIGRQPDDIDELAASYKRSLESYIKIPFPSLEDRKIILTSFEDVFSPNMYLTELANKTLKKITDDHNIIFEHENTVYKILLSLFFARAFHVEVDVYNRNNPVILDNRCTADELFDRLSVNYVSTLIKAPNYIDINPEALSKVIHENNNEVNIAKCMVYIDEARDALKGKYRVFFTHKF